MPDASPAPPPIVTFEQARSIVERHAAEFSANATESISLLDSAGRVLAEPVTADRDLPPFPRATRDGYAVRSADLNDIPALLRVAGEIKAGPASMPEALRPGQAFSIMTGAPVPPGADGVVMVEYTAQDVDTVEISRGVSSGENVVPQGAEARRGQVLLERGTRLNEAAIALAASVGAAELRVFKRPRIAVLTTGDEIVDVNATPGRTQIRNSNTYSLAAQITKAGAEPVLLPIAPDEPKRLRELIEQGLQYDLLIMTGGVSMGRYDLVEQVLAELKAEFFFTGAKIQPGKPVVFGRVGSAESGVSAVKDQKYFFGLPGNPISTMVTFELFARAIVEALAGMRSRPLQFTHARAKAEVKVKPGLKRFLPAQLTGAHENTEVELVPWQGSGDLAAQAKSNCYLVVPEDCERIAQGEWVAVMMRDRG